MWGTTALTSGGFYACRKALLVSPAQQFLPAVDLKTEPNNTGINFNKKKRPTENRSLWGNLIST